MLLSSSDTAGTTWWYMCSSGLQLWEKLQWCSSSQCSSSRASRSSAAGGRSHHGDDAAAPAAGPRLEEDGSSDCKVDTVGEFWGWWEPEWFNHCRWRTRTMVWTI